MRSFRERSPWLVGIVSLILLSIGVTLAFSVNRFQVLRGVYSISADLQDAAGLQPGNEVRVAGVKVGRVTGITLAPRAARIEMEIEMDVQLPRSTRVEVKLKTLLGQKFVDLQMPGGYTQAGSVGGDVFAAGGGFLRGGDVIPRSQTQIPYDIYQAASAGTEKLAKIDKKALRKLLNVLASTIGGSGDELVRALVALDDVGGVLSTKSQQISALLRNTDKLSGILASSGGDIDALLARSSEVLDTLARRRASLRSLLAATQGLAGNLGTLVQVSRGSVRLGVRDLSSILTLAEEEMGSIDEALAEFERAQRLFAQNTRFGKFIEGHVCAITTEDTCVPYGSPQAAGLPIKGTQPSPSPSVSPILRAP